MSSDTFELLLFLGWLGLGAASWFYRKVIKGGPDRETLEPWQFILLFVLIAGVGIPLLMFLCWFGAMMLAAE